MVCQVKQEKLDDYAGIKYVFPSVNVSDVTEIQQFVISGIKKQTDLDIKINAKIAERLHPQMGNQAEYFYCEIVSDSKISVNPDSDNESLVWVEKEKLVDYMPTLYKPVEDYLRSL